MSAEHADVEIAFSNFRARQAVSDSLLHCQLESFWPSEYAAASVVCAIQHVRLQFGFFSTLGHNAVSRWTMNLTGATTSTGLT